MKTAPQPTISNGIDANRIEDALRVSYDAFSAKLGGFRSADDMVRLFRDAVDGTSCLSTSSADGGGLLGVLTFHTEEKEFYHLNAAALFMRFTPARALRVLFSLTLLDLGQRPAPDEFIVDSLAVARSARGTGVGTALMRKAECTARDMGKNFMSLGVIGENAGAIRLYERLGYAITRTERGFLPRLATGGSEEVHRMEKRIGEGSAVQ